MFTTGEAAMMNIAAAVSVTIADDAAFRAHEDLSLNFADRTIGLKASTIS